MKQKKGIILHPIFISIAILVFIFAFLGYFKEANLLSFYTPEGYVTYSDLETAHTNLQQLSDQHNYESKFYKTIGDVATCCGSGDNDFTITADPNRNLDTNIKLQFKGDISERKFKIDYSTYTGGSSTCEDRGANVNGLGLGHGLQTGTIEIEPQFLNSKISDIEFNNQKQGTIDCTNDCSLTFSANSGTERLYKPCSASINLKFPRWKPDRSCEIDTDETLVFDTFTGGSTFTLKELSYEAVKLCPDVPPILRSITETGLKSDTKGTVLDRLDKNIETTVPDGTVMTIFYITKTEGTPLLRCNLDSAYDVQQEECITIKQAQGLIPDLTPSIRVVPIELGTLNLLYKQNYLSEGLRLGDTMISATAPKFICQNEIPSSKHGYVHVGEPRKPCWISTFGGKSMALGSSAIVNDYMSAELINIEGRGVYFGEKIINGQTLNLNGDFVDRDDWVNVWKVTFATDSLKINSDDPIKAIKLNKSGATWTVDVTNNIANFDGNLAGVIVSYRTKLLETYEIQTYNFPFNKGINQLNIPLKTDRLGYVEVTAKPFFNVRTTEGTYQILGQEQAILVYEVKEEISGGTGVVIKTPSLWDKIVSFFANLFSF